MNFSLTTPSLGYDLETPKNSSNDTTPRFDDFQIPELNNNLSSVETDTSISPSRRNFERIRKSLKKDSASTIGLKSGSISEDSLSWKRSIILDEIQPIFMEKMTDEGHTTLEKFSPGKNQIVLDISKDSNDILMEKIGQLSFIEEMKQNTDRKARESIHFIYGNFKDLYEEKETLGEGCSGVVKRCVHEPSGQAFAVKILETMGDEERLLLEINQFKSRKTLFHKQIVTVFDLYIDLKKNKVYTVMEYIDQLDLQKHLEADRRFEEEAAATLLKQVLLGVQYLHQHGVCHRDLKLSNILASRDGKIVRILDFDVSKFKTEGTKYSALKMDNMKMWTYTGTLYFLAPEFFEDMEYTEAIDQWSLGVVLYALLTGHLPFDAPIKEDLIKEITSGNFNTERDEWRNISAEGQDLIKALLQKDYRKRLTPFEALAHPWIIKNTSVESKDSDCNRGFEVLVSPFRIRKPSRNMNKSLFSENNLIKGTNDEGLSGKSPV